MRFYIVLTCLITYLLGRKERILVESTETITTTSVGSESEPVSPEPTGPQRSVSVLNGAVTVTRAFNEEKTEKIHHILDIEWNFSTFFYDYSKRNNIATFIAKDNNVFKLVKQNTTILYDPETECECAEKVVYEENVKITIYKLDHTSQEIKLKLITIDIKNKQSTDKIDYVSDKWENTETFTAKGPNLICSVRKDDEVVWEAKNGNYPNKLIYSVDKDNNEDLKIIYPEDEDGDIVIEGRVLTGTANFYEQYTYLFSDTVTCARVSYNNKPVWKCEKVTDPTFVKVVKKGTNIELQKGTSIKSQKDLKVFIITKGSTTPNDDTKYHFTQPSKQEGHYIFKKGVKCTEIKVNNEVIWKHNIKEYGGTFPKAVSYYGTDEVVITFSDFLLFLEQSDEIWNPLFFDDHGPTDPERQTEKSSSEVTLFTHDPSDNSKTVTLDTSKYNIKKYSFSSTLFHYNFNKSANCALIKHEDKEVWKYESGNNDAKYPLSFSYNKTDSNFVIRFPFTYTFFDKDVNGKWRETNLNLNLFRESFFDKTKTLELDTSKYQVVSYPQRKNLFFYDFKTDSECTLIKHENKEVWKHDSTKYNNKYPLSMDYNMKNSVLLLNFGNFEIKCTKGTDGEWNCNEPPVLKSPGQDSQASTTSPDQSSGTGQPPDQTSSSSPTTPSGGTDTTSTPSAEGTTSDQSATTQDSSQSS